MILPEGNTKKDERLKLYLEDTLNQDRKGKR